MSENQDHGGDGKDHLVRIHIDREPYEVRSPTTGEKLYEEGHIGPHKELFREVDGDEEDELISRDDKKIGLVQDEHFYSQKDFEIVVNAVKKPVPGPRVNFDQIVKLAFPTPIIGPNIVYTVAYRKGPKQNPKGTMLEGQSVLVKNGMIFDVTQTDKS